MDQIDAASANEQMEREISLKIAMSVPKMVERGSCYWCDAPLDRGLFCQNEGCAEDFDLHQKSLKIKGAKWQD